MFETRIFTVGHSIKFDAVKNSLFTPFVTGVTNLPDGVLGDNSGDSIAHKASYCEMRAQYYVWRNIRDERPFIGFQQYRRLFILDKFYDYSKKNPLSAALCKSGKCYGGEPVRVEPYVFNNYLDWMKGWTWNQLNDMEKWLSRWDVIAPRALMLPGGMADQYIQCHVKSHWECFVSHIDQHKRFSRLRGCYDYKLPYLIPFNMYILKKDLFSDYMEYWHDIMSGVEKEIDVGIDPYQSRALGFLSERLFTIYLYLLRLERPGISAIDLPCLVHA